MSSHVLKPPARVRNPERPIWEEAPTLVGRLGKPVVLALVFLIIAFPLYVVVVTSLSSTEAVARAGGLVVVPRELTLAAYVQLLSGGVVTRALVISTVITIVGTAFSLVITVLAAYGLSRPGSLWHRPLLFVVLLTFLFGPGIIPSYLLVNSLGLIDNYAVADPAHRHLGLQPDRDARLLHGHSG